MKRPHSLRRRVEALEPRRLLALAEFAILGDYGLNGPNKQAVVNLVESWTPDAILTVGDNNYLQNSVQGYDLSVGQYFHQYIGNYQGAYGAGSPTNRFFPALGNHDADFLPHYLTFFDLPGPGFTSTTGTELYYDVVWANVHVFIVDSNAVIDETQLAWLSTGLAQSTAEFQIVLMHHPPYSAGTPHPWVQLPYAAWGADAVLAGHTHWYERMLFDGIPYFINGVGGGELYEYGEPLPESQFLYNDNYGAMRLVADEGSLVFEFYSIDDGGTLLDTFTVRTPAEVVGRQVFYNNSRFDGFDPAANANDDAAIAVDKAALLPGQTATFANYTGYSLGINGLMIDVERLAGTPTASDFLFKVGNNNRPDTWAALATPPTVAVRPGAGVGGSDRVTLIWPDQAITKRWLQVTVRASANTGLSSDDVFYFGNAVGESGNSTTDAVVNAADEIGARVHPVGPFPTAAVTNVVDFNHDRLVDAADQIIARVSSTNPLTALRLIAVPADTWSARSAGAPVSELPLPAGVDDLSPAAPSRRRRR